MTVVFIVFFFFTICLTFTLIYKFKCQKESHIHNEVTEISKNQTRNIKTIFRNSETPPQNLDPQNLDPQNVIFLQAYKEIILKKTLEEYEQSINGVIAPVRKNRQRKRIENRHNKKGVKN